ncbi:ABC transporter permease [Jiulongibacter sediminis]|uniref:Cell division protein FtsX n=1 Tax=Jiulongibacter sediminis TaxID=1605367 RepID=A0A0P7C224_9BACT|nr:ABC transporter permease [Jiulongibacter sediminis]KPM47376.1 hypothetical protein AFM12_16010 [Jiulongibacter sediminis]TBX22928.1 hypothetical protein TK44_16020 [Jiulongibacter sediminis]
MIQNYLKIAWRSLLKNKSTFAINVVGLAIGVATCLIIMLFVVDELTYDSQHEKRDRIERIVLKAQIGEEIINEGGIPAPFAAALERDFPEVEAATRTYTSLGEPKITYQNEARRNGAFAFIDPNFFQVFTVEFIQGDETTALTSPNQLVLTESQAKGYFGSEDPLGKTLEIEGVNFYGNGGYAENDGLYTVTGVIADFPDNSHFNFDHLGSMGSNKDAVNQSYIGGSYHTYVLLKEGTNTEAFQAKLAPFVKKYMGEQLATALRQSYEEFEAMGNYVNLFTEPLSDVHFSEAKAASIGGGGTGNRSTVYMFGAIALFMLLIACINFMNLSTASASKRVKEIGMRKVLGSEKRQLVFQFLSEAFIASAIAVLLGLAVFVIALPFFNQLADKSFTVSQVLNIKFGAGLLFLALLVGLLAGLYPAFFMSSFKPLLALKNRFTSSASKGVRGGLVTFQFAVSVILIMGTLVVGYQMHFIQNKDVGYEREQIIVLRDAGRLGNNLDAFKTELKSDSRVASVTTSAFVPAGSTDQNGTTVDTKHEPIQVIRTKVYNIDEDYIPTLGMTMVQGRNFSQEYGSEEKSVIVNETAIKAFALDNNPVGQTLRASTDGDGNRENLEIIGVVKDFHALSLREPIEPLIMRYSPYYGLIIKTQSEDVAGLISSMKTQWDSFDSGETFEYAFLDELYNETYIKETHMNTLLRAFALLTIFVACLGLFGLVTFTAEQRFKEIGIRKTLGSSVPQIVALLSKDFLKLIAISFLVAFPLGYYLMNLWLQDFEYRVNIEWWVYAVAGLATIVVALLTISFRSIKAALMNPVKSLRSE